MDPENLADEPLVGIGESSRQGRIETQIHRRRAAKAFSPLMLEWEQERPAPPDRYAD